MIALGVEEYVSKSRNIKTLLRANFLPCYKDFRRLADTLGMNTISSAYSGSLGSALSSGTATLAAGAQQLDRDAQQIADPEAQYPAAALVDLTQSSQLAQAGAAVIRTSNEMLGSLFDALA